MNLAGPTLIAVFARVIAWAALVLVLAFVAWLAHRRWWKGVIALLVLGGLYALVWFTARPSLDHAWFYLLSNAKRSYATYRQLTWAEAFLPGCRLRENDTFRRLVYKEAKREAEFPTPAILQAYLAVAEKPDARRVLLVGPRAKYYRAFLENAGTLCVDEADADGRFDIVFVALEPDWICGARQLGASAWRRLANRVTARGVIAWAFDTRLLSAGRFKRFLEEFPCPQTHLWMPGANDWLLVGRLQPRQLKLAAMMELFSRPKAFRDLALARCDTVYDFFASYVGARADIEPALAKADSESGLVARWRAPRLAFSDADGEQVRPEFFVSKEATSLDWLAADGMEPDLWRSATGEMRSMQNVRRQVVEGMMQAAAGKKEAIDVWAKAALRNPRDPMLRAVLDRFDSQAKELLGFGNVGGALKLYENMLLICPSDAVSMRKYGLCLKRIGQDDLSMQVLKRAKELEDEQSNKH